MSNNIFQLQGEIIEKYSAHIENARFKWQEIVIKTQEKYPQTVLVRFNYRIDHYLSPFREGNMVTVEVRIRGWEYKGKHYVKLIGKNIDYL